MENYASQLGENEGRLRAELLTTADLTYVLLQPLTLLMAYYNRCSNICSTSRMSGKSSATTSTGDKQGRGKWHSPIAYVPQEKERNVEIRVVSGETT